MPDARIREILEGTGSRQGSTIPLMVVRARMFVAGQPPVAILWLGGRHLTVREGTDIHLFGTNPMQMKVSRITSNEVRLDIVGKNQFITLD